MSSAFVHSCTRYDSQQAYLQYVNSKTIREGSESKLSVQSVRNKDMALPEAADEKAACTSSTKISEGLCAYLQKRR